MRNKFIILICIVILLTSCDEILSFFVSPGYNIPAHKFGWTVDMANSHIVGDLAYFPVYGNDENSWSIYWVPDTLILNLGSNNSLVSTLDFPFEIQKYDNVNSPMFYLLLLFKYDFGGNIGLDITTGGAVPTQDIVLGWFNNSETQANYTMTATASSTASYTLPEPAYLGIDGNDTTTVLTGGLNILNFNITADHDFVSGHATCVFSNTDPAGLLYMAYYHDSGLVSLIYAHDVATTETGNYFPDGHYEYIWSVYRP